jgi:tripartite-type tricarboxylate transporter receptor subunit TctC
MENGMRKALLGIICGLLAIGAAHAQQFPNQPIRLVLGFAPGGITDFSGRVIAQGLSKALGGHPVVPENKPGAAGVTAAAYVARSAPDGYTLVLIDPGTVINPMLRAGVPYKMSELTTIGMVGSSPVVIVTSHSLPVKDLKELIDYGLKNPRKLSFASAGIGSAPHLSAELFQNRTGMKMLHIPYAGIGGAYPDLMSGKIQLAFSSIVGALPFTSDNKVLAIATTGSKRPVAYPNIPTVGEAALPGYSVDIWLALSAPAGTPEPVIKRLHTVLNEALKERDVIDALAKVGIEAWATSTSEANAFVEEEGKRWPSVIQEAGLGPK